MSKDDLIFVRHIVSGVAIEMTRRKFERSPFKEYFEIVRTDKPVPAEIHTPRTAKVEKEDTVTVTDKKGFGDK